MQPVLVTTRAKARFFGLEKEHDIAMPVLWHAPVSKEPKHYAISVSKKTQYAELLKQAGVFCINFCKPEHIELALEQSLPQTLTGACEIIDCNKLRHEPHLECETVHTLDLGDHYLIVGKVLVEKK